MVRRYLRFRIDVAAVNTHRADGNAEALGDRIGGMALKNLGHHMPGGSLMGILYLRRSTLIF